MLAGANSAERPTGRPGSKRDQGAVNAPATPEGVRIPPCPLLTVALPGVSRATPRGVRPSNPADRPSAPFWRSDPAVGVACKATYSGAAPAASPPS